MRDFWAAKLNELFQSAPAIIWQGNTNRPTHQGQAPSFNPPLPLFGRGTKRAQKQRQAALVSIRPCHYLAGERSVMRPQKAHKHVSIRPCHYLAGEQSDPGSRMPRRTVVSIRPCHYLAGEQNWSGRYRMGFLGFNPPLPLFGRGTFGTLFGWGAETVSIRPCHYLAGERAGHAPRSAGAVVSIRPCHYLAGEPFESFKLRTKIGVVSIRPCHYLAGERWPCCSC